MSDFIAGKITRTQGEEIAQVFSAGQEAEFVFGRGTQVFPNLPVPIYGTTVCRMTADADGFWFELGFAMDAMLNGNAAAGFTDPAGYFKIEVQQSEDLQNWQMGEFLPAPVPVVDVGGGVFEYWSRCVTPAWWTHVLNDFVVTSDRHGKSITSISLLGSVIPLAYPYAMPSQAAALQTALRSAGHPAATVTTQSAPISVIIKDHQPSVARQMIVTLNGASQVTDVRYYGGATIPLAYPYPMPLQAAALQSALRSAGVSGAVVNLYADTWTITLPDITTGGASRPCLVTYTPGDPFPHWDFFDTYLGLSPANSVAGVPTNTRTLGGAPLFERLKQFARLKISAGNRYDPYLTP